MDRSIIVLECAFKAVRSSGAGGQHVNKVSSKIELTFNVSKSLGLSIRKRFTSKSLKVNQRRQPDFNLF